MRWPVLLVLAGCYNPEARPCEIPPGQTSCTPDAAIDKVDADTTRYCLGNGMLEICFDGARTNDEVVGSRRIIDGTACDQIVQSGSSPVCVMLARRWEITNTLRLTGDLPIVLVAPEEIRVNAGGTIDASSTSFAPITSGPGSDVNCGFSLPGTGTATNGSTGAGGAGASLTSLGGRGGNGIGGTLGAGANTPFSITRVRGGCAGGPGGNYIDAAQTVHAGGTPGRGGGAVYLIAKHIFVEGAINASGAAGRPPNISAGGAGGGSGGFIGLDAAEYTIGPTARIFAVGGGGSSGGSSSGIGKQGFESLDGNAPEGGGAAMMSGPGGAGGVTTGGSGIASPGSNTGGGGGGGAGGFIGVANISVLVAPAETIKPPPTGM